MSRLLKFPAGIALAVAATVGWSALGLRAGPDFLLVPVASVARTGHPVPAILAGLLAGLLEDVLRNPPRLLGLHAFGKIVVGYVLAALAARAVVEKPASAGGVLGAAVLLEGGILSLLLWFLHGELLVEEPLPLVVRIVSTGLLGSAVLVIARVPWAARRQARRRRRPPEVSRGL